MESTECFALRHLKIQNRQNAYIMYSIIQDIRKMADKSTMHILKQDHGYDVTLRIKKNKIIYAVYIESIPLNQSDINIDIRLFLDKYFKRLKKIVQDSNKILIYITYSLDVDDWITHQNLSDDEMYMKDYKMCLILNETVIQKLLLYNNVSKNCLYTKFLRKAKFISYEINNYSQRILGPLLGPKIYKHLLNPNRLNLRILKQTIENVESFNENIKLHQNCMGLSEFNVDFVNQLYIRFGMTAERTWERIFNDTSINIVYVDTMSTLLSTKKVVDYVSSKRFKFILLSAKQLREKNILEEAYHNFSRGKIDVLIIECDEETKKADNPISASVVKSVKAGKIIEISYDEYPENSNKNNSKRINEHLKYQFDEVTFKDLDEPSMQSILNARIMFQGHDITLKEIANIATIEKCINIKDLEDLIVGWDFHVGSKIDFKFMGPLYLQRTIRRKILPDKMLQSNLANSCLVIVYGENLEKVDITKEQDFHRNKGILLVSDASEAQKTFQKYREQINIPNVYLVELKNGLFFLEDFKVFDSKVVDCLEDIAHAEEITTNELLTRRKINLVIGNPGIGKTVFLNYLAIQIKNNYPYSWVAYVNLGNNTSYVQHIFNTMEKFKFDSDIQNSVIDLLIPIITIYDKNVRGCQFATELFKLEFKNCNTKYKHPNYIFLFDAFDELIENHQKKAINLFHFLISRNFPVWITSRPHQKRRLEEDLRTVALSINPLINSQMNEYFSAYYKNNFIRMSYQSFYHQIESLLLSLDNTATEFAGYPVHLEFLTKYCLSLNGVYHLLHRFIYHKFELYYQQKIPPKGFKVTRKIDSLFEFHKQMVLHKYNLIKPVEFAHYKIKNEELLRIGLVALEGNELTFIHPFVKAHFIAFSAIHSYQNLLKNIISDEKYEFVRSILNSVTYKITNRNYSDCWKVGNTSILIKNLTREGNKNLAKFIVQTMFKEESGYNSKKS
ncbi:uncharacterized protein LOC143195993 [Rhynchophorus ferrugineus]|uniref:uncharacterized protein LOC143195993 n=1 Tax=Rhynchophorus ferrugineus TaxID=354439 RepID=UPI003FCC650A